MAPSSRLVVQSVRLRFGASWVLRGVDAEFHPGTLTVLEGANGAGKSTLLAILGGLLAPTAGWVRWQPEGLAVRDSRERVGWLGHDSAAYRDLCVRENVEVVAKLQGASRFDVGESLRRVGAGSLADFRVGVLSRGQRQRVALARAIVHGPQLLLLDEPFTGLDAAGCALLERIVKEEQQRGATVVLVSHDGSLAKRLGGNACRLERGKICGEYPIP